MNILVSAIYNYDSYARGIMPDVLQTLIDENPGATIYYLTNSHTFNICYFNIGKKPEKCYLCKSGVKNTLKLISGDFTHISIADILKPEDRTESEKFIEEGKDEIFDLFYENFDVGAGTLSTYISTTRDRDLLNTGQPFIRELAENSLSLFLAVKRFLVDKKIDVVYNFNGRHGYVRAIMKAAMYTGIDCYNVERTRFDGHIDFYKNKYTHDPEAKFSLVEEYWKISDLSDKEKQEIGVEFYRRQESGEDVVFPSFTKKMKKGQVPSQFRNGNKNIVLFNSSDDEIASLGEFFKYPFFKDQNEGLRFLVDYIGKELQGYNLIIRMHPNLSNVEFPYVQEIYKFHQEYPNIFVVPPDSSVDSYALMGIGDKILTFGSTTGLEANFKRKPVILLGKGFFYFADYAFKPGSRKELKQLLIMSLKPKPIDDTLKVGFYFQQGGVPTKYYEEPHIGEGIYFKGLGIPYYTYSQRMSAKIIKFTYAVIHKTL